MSFDLDADRRNGIAHLPQCRTCGARIASTRGIVDGECCWCRPPTIVKVWPDGSRTEDRCGRRYRVSVLTEPEGSQ